MPLLYNAQKKKLLETSVFQKKKYKDIMEAYESDFKKLKNANIFDSSVSMKDFIEGYKLFESRNFGLAVEKQKKATLIPLVDLFNYDYKNNRAGWFYDQKSQSFVISAHNSIKKGEEVSF